MQLDPGSQHSALFQVDPHPDGGLWVGIDFDWLQVCSCWVKRCLWSEWADVGELACSASLEHLLCGSQWKVLAQKGTEDALILLLYTDTHYFQGQRCWSSSRVESSLLLWLQEEADECPQTVFCHALLS